MIIFEDLTCGYTASPILQRINWTIKEGEHWVVTGPMASGKTTLVNTIMGKTRKLSGCIRYTYLNNPSSYEERKKTIHFVSFTDTGKLFDSVNAVHYYQQRYQAFDSDGHLTVRGYLKEGGLNEQDPDHLEFIDLMNLRPLLDMERIKLSSGQTRKILLCKAFLGQPKFLLLDNPHIGLDDPSRHLFNNYLDKLVIHFNQQIILSGHFRSLPSCINRQLMLKEGKITYSGPRVYEKPIEKIKLKDPGKIVEQFQNKRDQNFSTILKFDHIQIKYGKNEVIKSLNWEVKAGDKWLVEGPNGAGKSTIISLIYGDHPQAYSNKITLFDQKRGQGESIWDIKKRIGFTSPELHSYFNYNHPAEEVVLSGYSDTLFVQHRKEIKPILSDLLFDYFDITSYKKIPFKELSTGLQRVLFFIRALVKAPSVLLLDEPYQGMDQATVQKCNLLLKNILTPAHTLIFISHFRDEVPGIIDKILKLDHFDPK
ncbi:MAG: ATP-binding cassette domain-containing protein [Saprospiraceae bacterium]|nr:ATP-binding cassette domain-containing protein [Saprospiraceae bacterium]